MPRRTASRTPALWVRRVLSCSHGLHHAQARPARPAGRRLHAPGDSQSRPAGHRRDTGQYAPQSAAITSAQVVLIGADDLAQVFRVELTGERRGVHQITEQHGELAAFRVRRSRATWCSRCLRRRDVGRGRQRPWRGGGRCAGRPTGPDEHAALFIHRQLFRIDQVIFEMLPASRHRAGTAA